MKKFAFCLIMASLTAYSADAQKPAAKKPAAPAKPVLKNAMDSFSYAAGLNIAASLKDQGVPPISTSAMARAIDDAYAGKNTLLTREQAEMTLQQKLQEYARKKTDVEKTKGAAFLAENAKRKGVVSLPNGLQYEVLESGHDSSGLKPKPSDKVTVHYTGTLIDGTIFDSSVQRNEPATFSCNGVIRGWTEILQLMSKGDKWKVYIPSDLGYGDQGMPPAIAPGATLIFEIKLLDIIPAAKL